MHLRLVPVVASYLAAFARAAENGSENTLHDCILAAVGEDPSLAAFQGQPFYQSTAVKPYNFNWPVTPAAVTFPKSSTQVASVVKCAADRRYKVQPKSGGHSYANYGLGGDDGAVVVDLSNLKQFSMDTSNYHATIGGGMLGGEIDRHLHAAGGRAMSHGICPQIGIGGHATIGGQGPTSRQFGMALDHVVGAEVVLANGTIVRASESQHQDLLFGIKGAGGSFGIVTEFTMRTEEEAGEAVQYSYTFGFGDTSSRASLFKDWTSFISEPNLSRKVASTCTILPGSVVVSGTYFGPKSEYDDLNIEEKFPGATNASVIVFRDWLGLVGSISQDFILELGGGVPASFYSKSLSFTPKTLPPAKDIDELFHYLDTADTGSLLWFVLFDLEGGAMNDVPADATGYVHRDTLLWMQSYAIAPGQASQTTYDFLDGVSRVLTSSYPDVDFGAYPGYVDPRLPDARKAYWGSNLGKLEEIKGRVDPKDVFHNPQGVLPSI